MPASAALLLEYDDVDLPAVRDGQQRGQVRIRPLRLVASNLAPASGSPNNATLIARALLRAKNGQILQAVADYRLVAENLKEIIDPKAQETAAGALYNAALYLQEVEHWNEAIHICDTILDRFSDSPQSTLYTTAMTIFALFMKGRSLSKLGQNEKAIVQFDAGFYKATGFPTSDLQVAVAAAFIGKAQCLTALGRIEDTIHAYNDAAEQSRNTTDAVLNLILISSLYEKGMLLYNNGRPEDAICDFDDALEFFEKSTPHTDEISYIVPLQRYAAKSGLFKSLCLRQINRSLDAIVVCSDIIDKFHRISDEETHGVVTRSLSIMGATLFGMKRFDEAIAAFDDAIRRGDLPIQMIAQVLYGKARSLLSLQGRALEAIAVYREIIERFEEDSNANAEILELVSLATSEIKSYYAALNDNTKYGRIDIIDASDNYADAPDTHQIEIGTTDKKDEGLMQEPRNVLTIATEGAHAAAAEITARTEPQLTEPELSRFRAHALANPWDSTGGIAPSMHIATTFAQWLGRGLRRIDIAKAQPNLANAYAAEISRNPSKRVEGLAVRPHKLPPDAPRPLSMRRAAELNEEELAAKRAHGRAQKKRSRQKLNALTRS